MSARFYLDESRLVAPFALPHLVQAADAGQAAEDVGHLPLGDGLAELVPETAVCLAGEPARAEVLVGTELIDDRLQNPGQTGLRGGADVHSLVRGTRRRGEARHDLEGGGGGGTE